MLDNDTVFHWGGNNILNGKCQGCGNLTIVFFLGGEGVGVGGKFLLFYF